MIRENQILADEDNMPIIPYEGDSANPDETAALEVTSKADVIPTSAKALALADEAKKEEATTKAEPEKKDGGQSEIKRAQAIATLSYYGLTDPTNQEDVAKAVQAVAAATGDQATAVALWHMIIGSEDGAGTSLTEQQIERSNKPRSKLNILSIGCNNSFNRSLPCLKISASWPQVITQSPTLKTLERVLSRVHGAIPQSIV